MSNKEKCEIEIKQEKKDYERAERTSYILDAMEKIELCWQMKHISDYHYNTITTILANEIAFQEIKEADQA